MGKGFYSSKTIHVTLIMLLLIFSLVSLVGQSGHDSGQTKGFQTLQSPRENKRMGLASSDNSIDGGTIGYTANVSVSSDVSIWYGETIDSTPRGSLFTIGIAVMNEFLIPGQEFTAILYLKPLSFADQYTVDFHDIIFYYRVLDDNGLVLYNGTFDEMYNEWFELYLNTDEDHIGFSSLTFTVPMFVATGNSYHEVKAVFREDVIGELDPINEMGWYRLLQADIATANGKNTGTKSSMKFVMNYRASWSLTVEQIGSTGYYFEMNGDDYSVEVLSYYSEFLTYNLTALGNDAVQAITLNDTDQMISYEEMWSIGETMMPYSTYPLGGVIFAGTIDSNTNSWTNVGRKSSVSAFFLGVFPYYFGWGWGNYETLPHTGDDAFVSADTVAFLGNTSKLNVGNKIGQMSVTDKKVATYCDVPLETTILSYSSEDGSQSMERKISTRYGFLLEETSEISLSYQTSEKWQVQDNFNESIVITSLQFIDSTSPRVISNTEFSIYEGILPQITLEIEEKFPAEYSLYRDGILVDSGEWNSTKLTLFLEILPKGTYEYKLYLTDKMRNTGIETINLHVLEPTIPSPPEDLIVSIQEQGVLLLWKPPKDDGGSQLINYVIYRRMVNETNYSFLDNATTTQYLDNNVVIGQIYYYVVTAVNSMGESRPSNEGQIVIPTTISFGGSDKGGSSGFLQFSLNTALLSLVFGVATLAIVRRKRE